MQFGVVAVVVVCAAALLLTVQPGLSPDTQIHLRASKQILGSRLYKTRADSCLVPQSPRTTKLGGPLPLLSLLPDHLLR